MGQALAPRSVLIIENDNSLRRILVEHLVASGQFCPCETGTLGAAAKCLEASGAPFDTILLDTQLPDGDGSDFCFSLRRQGHKMPIILLGHGSPTTDIIRGLDAGANDYITDTTRLNELLARLRAQLRGFDDSVDAVFTIGSSTFWPAAKLLVNARTHHRIGLTNKETALLKFLYARGRFVTRQLLLSEVWGYKTDMVSTTLEAHIYTLRQKMQADAALLVTMPGGYQLAASA